MDPDMYNAAMKGKMVYGKFSLADLRRVENRYQVTPNGNTILHVAALFGQQNFVGKVLQISTALLCYKNMKNETALHIAADLGQSEVVRKLLSFEGVETLVRMTDDIGDTALHKAVRSGHVDIVRSLMDLLQNPAHDFPANKAGETPLYLAAESGFHDALIEILNVCKEPTYVTGPLNRTPLHAAVFQEHTGWNLAQYLAFINKVQREFTVLNLHHCLTQKALQMSLSCLKLAPPL
ncbi:ankyrin-3-like isoform X2 [Solanum tuberosum]|uniref:ankyrin-3-like isoform X2 n=1 Tax=Solanum tuberosum TaxID=4113 RepID=UPI00073A425E|nr:PREDICTED: ankyrin-3-like isoform X2 [Solanum tuberosum]